MGQGKEEKKKSSLAGAAVATASVALGYAALELGLGGVLKPGREAIKQSLEPQEEQAAASEVVQREDHDAQVQVQGNTTQAPVEEPDTAASLQQHAATAASPPIEQEEQKQR